MNQVIKQVVVANLFWLYEASCCFFKCLCSGLQRIIFDSFLVYDIGFILFCLDSFVFCFFIWSIHILTNMKVSFHGRTYMRVTILAFIAIANPMEAVTRAATIIVVNLVCYYLFCLLFVLVPSHFPLRKFSKVNSFLLFALYLFICFCVCVCFLY